MKVLILADTHYDNGERHLHYPDSSEVLPKFWGWLGEQSSSCDLVAVCGDITVKGTVRRSEIAYVKKKFEQNKIPYLITPGNHDLCATKGMEDRYPDLEEYEYKPLNLTNYYAIFGEEGVRYSKVMDGIRFIGFAIRNGDPDGQIEWLQKQLNFPEQKLVFGHYPLVPSRTGGYCLEWGYSRIDESIEILREMIGDKKNNVLAYFCGHQHINSIVPLGASFQIETASTVLGVTSYRIMEIDQQEINISTHRLPFIQGTAGALVLPDRAIDATHPDPFTYNFGNEADLSITISRK